MNWFEYTAEQVRTSKDSEGVRLALLFNQDYKEIFGTEIDCLTCKGSFERKFNKYIEAMSETKELKYKLKPKYNGIPVGFGKSGRAVNGKITKEQAEHLYSNHPKGAELFEVYPEQKEKPLDKMNKAELLDYAKINEIDLGDASTKAEILEVLQK